MYMKNRKQKCHAESLLLSISSLLTKQRDPEQKHLRMTQGGAVHGFTLIELLVVVLIIGILSAIALPQYQKAVRKARISEARINLRALVDASDRYILETGDTSNVDLSNLDISIPTETKNWSYSTDDCGGGTNGKSGCRFVASPSFENGYEIAYASINYYGGEEWDETAGHFACISYDTTDKICPSLGKSTNNEFTFIID